jgi:hypothetical protein
MTSTLKNNKWIVEFEKDEINEEILSFLSYITLAKKSKATQQEIDLLAKNISQNWWDENKNRFINEADS